MEAKNFIDQEEKLNATNLEGIHYEYKYNPEFKRYDIEFESATKVNSALFSSLKHLW